MNYDECRPQSGQSIVYQSLSGKLLKGVVVRVEADLCWTKYEGSEKIEPFIWRFKDGLNTLHDWPTKGEKS
jgi:hypothetical protein